MIPTLFKLGPIALHSYGLCLALGLIVGNFLMYKELKRRGLPEDFAGTTITLAAIFGIIGARIFDILEHPEGFMAHPWKTLLSGAGLTWYGGFIFATVAIYIASRRRGIPWWPLVETTVPGLAIGYGFGRLGCLLSGDGCYGVGCSAGLPSPLCMAFPNGIVPTTEVVYNTPLWEIFGAIGTFAYIWAIREKVTRPPGLFLRFLVVHGVLRFAVEFVRRNPKLVWGLSQAQVIYLAIVAVGLAGLTYMAKHPETATAEPVRVEAKQRHPGKKKRRR